MNSRPLIDSPSQQTKSTCHVLKLLDSSDLPQTSSVDGVNKGHLSTKNLELVVDHSCRSIIIRNGETVIDRLDADQVDQFCLLEESALAVRLKKQDRAMILRFSTPAGATLIENWLVNGTKESTSNKSLFDQRTEESSAAQYFQFYGYLSQQQNMLQDYVRTYTYQRAVLSNTTDFANKVILDVGAGSGILSFFAVQAGARRVYAVEASNMAQCCQTLVASNNLQDKIIVLAGKIEEVEVPEKVDTIISEPMGYMLLNERMLETFLHAKKFLKPEVGKMFPSKGDLHIAPFTDEALYLEQCSKANFWFQNSFHGVNVTSLAGQALKEYFKQPIVDTFHPAILLARSVVWSLDFLEKNEEDLHYIDIPLEFVLQNTAYIHGLAFWFDVAFIGSNEDVWLSTASTEPLTHWYQVRCLLETPLFGCKGFKISGRVLLKANKRQSYDVEIVLNNGQGGISSNTLDLKNPCFRYTGQPVQPPPGNHHASPTEASYSVAQAVAAGTVRPDSRPGDVPMVYSNNVCLTNGLSNDASPGQVEMMANGDPIPMHRRTFDPFCSMPRAIPSAAAAFLSLQQQQHQQQQTTMMEPVPSISFGSEAFSAAVSNFHAFRTQQQQQQQQCSTNLHPHSVEPSSSSSSGVRYFNPNVTNAQLFKQDKI